MSDAQQGTNQIQKVTNPYEEYVIAEGVLTVTASSIGSPGYYGEATVDITYLNLVENLPDVDAWYYQPKALGGGVNEAAWYKFPFVKINQSDGKIEESLSVASAGNIGATDIVDPDSFKLRFCYFNQLNAGASRQIRYKVYSKRVGGLPTT